MSSNVVHFLVFVAVFFNFRCCSTSLSDVVDLCSAKDPGINTCVKDKLSKLFPLMVNGLDELGMMPTDPMYIEHFGLEKGNKHIPTLEFLMENSTHLAWKNVRVISANVEPEKYFYNMTFFFPVYQVQGDYVANGSIVSIPLQGVGITDLKMYNATYTLAIDGEPIMRNEELYMNIKDIHIKVIYDDMDMYLSNVYDSPAITELTNRLLNWSSKAISSLVYPATEDLFKPAHLRILQKVFATVPYRNMFKDLSLS